MNQKILFEIKKFEQRGFCRKFSRKQIPVSFFFTDRNKIDDFAMVIKNLPQNSAIVIREYDLDKKNREIFAQKIAVLARQRKLKILVGKDFELAKKIKADGIHFSDFDFVPLQFLKKKSFAKNFIFSFACHSYKSLLLAKKFKPDLSFISPIFPTSTHPDAKILGLRNLTQISFKRKKRNYLSFKICALGGIDYSNIRLIRKIGFFGFAAINLFKNFQ